MDALEIVKLHPSEWPLYRRLRLEALQSDPQAFGSAYEAQALNPASFWQGRLEAAAEGKTNWMLFARRNGRLVGMIGAFLEEDGETAHIVSVYVSAAERGRGTGKALMRAIIEEVRRHSAVRRFTLGVNQVQTAAVALYQRMGFRITGERNGYSGDGQPRQGYEMELSLEEWMERLKEDPSLREG